MSTWLSKLRRFSPLAWVVIVAVIAGAFFRLWNFTNTLQFLGDQGRDAQVVSRIFREKDIVLIGPVTSTGNMYLGPLYYYFMVPFLMLTYPNPIGPAYAIAVLSILTTALIYALGKEIVGDRAAGFATILFAFSSVVVLFARFSWNPNPAPLFGLLFLWCLNKTERKEPLFWAGIAACISVLMQLHYVALLTLIIAGVYWLKQLFQLRKTEPKLRTQFLFGSLAGIVIFFLSLSPLVAFDIRHGWLNVKSLQNFLVTSQESVDSLPLSRKISLILMETHGRSLQLFFETTLGKHRLLNTALLLIVIGVFISILQSKKEPYKTGYRILAVTYIISVCGLAFYRGSVFDHYIAFFFPATFLIFGVVLDRLASFRWGWGAVVFFFLLFLSYNIPRMPIRDLGWTTYDMQRTAQTIADRVKPGEKYNIVLLSETKDIYGENYRYFLTTTPNPPLRMERFGEVETLFIIDEQKIEKDVTNLPIYEIVVFPNHKPAEVYSVPGGPTITVLRK
jgi:4-amino-4-deoxy-L-arabinose transferase-like glycosyltransferase